MKTLCGSMDSQHEHLLHTEDVCQEGEFFRLFLELNKETKQLEAKGTLNKQNFFFDVMWVSKLAYLADTLCYLNKLNARVLHNYLCTEKQGRHIQKDAVFWDSFVQKRDAEMFTTFNVFLTSVDVNAKEFKYVLSTMGVSKELISKFLIGNRFHIKLCILSPYSNRNNLKILFEDSI